MSGALAIDCRSALIAKTTYLGFSNHIKLGGENRLQIIFVHNADHWLALKLMSIDHRNSASPSHARLTSALPGSLPTRLSQQAPLNISSGITLCSCLECCTPYELEASACEIC